MDRNQVYTRSFRRYKITQSSSLSTKTYTEQDADPIIKQHSIHWLVCFESYKKDRQLFIGMQYDWGLIYQDKETCAYLRGSTVLFGFRGTKESKDIYDDMRLLRGKDFPRAFEAKELVKKFIVDNPCFSIELMGHSLGGAIARVVGQELMLPVVTFNAAAPPSSPVVTGPNHINYHIMFDMISAWQNPDTIRIDKGFRPIPSFWSVLTIPTWLYAAFADVFEAHRLYSFSNDRKGVLVTTREENRAINTWFQSLPFNLRFYLLVVMLGITGRVSVKLPDL